MKNKNKLNKLIQSAGNKIIGTEVDSREIVRHFGKPYKFSGRVIKETQNYVTFKPLSGKYREELKFNKNSIKKLVVSGTEYNRN